MLIVCTPGVLASHLLAAIAVADLLPLERLWCIAKKYLTTETVDNFQKSVVWRALVAQSADRLFTVRIDDLFVTSTASLSYGSLLRHGTEQTILISPTEKCKYLYLTGTTNYHKIVGSLGEKPLELLGVIARYGSEGVLNSLLAQESNQDIRSIGVRLQKLESAGLIICRGVYVDKKHTNQSIHIRFAPDSLLAKQNADAEEEILVSRDVGRLRRLIIDALKKLSNQMRGFSDLRKDLKLEGSTSEIKFFKAVCNRLHHGGYVEKLHVELPQTKQRVYAMRLVKDLDASDNVNEPSPGLVEVKDELSDNELGQCSTAHVTPSFNFIFPLFHQIFLQVESRGETGTTVSEILKALVGTSEYRPYTRAFEQLPTYLSNSKTLKTFKKYAEPYDDYSVTKLYDHEGKVKFYRYFVTEFCKETRSKPKFYNLLPKSNKLSLANWEKKLKTSVGKISTDSLIEKKEKLLSPLQSGYIPAKREYAPLKSSQKRSVGPYVNYAPTELAQMAIDEQENRPKRARKATVVYSFDDPIEDVSDHDGAFEPEPDVKSEESDLGEALNTNELLIAPDLVLFDQKQRNESTSRRRVTKDTQKAPSSLSSQIRRTELEKILTEEGGAVIVGGNLLRKLDARLGKATETDNKTLLRDMSALTKEGVLETTAVLVGPDGKQVKRTLISLTRFKHKLSVDHLEAVKARFFQESLRKRTLSRRIVESELQLHVELPKQLSDVKVVTRRRERSENRLKSVDEQTELRSAKKETRSKKADASEVLKNLKKTRRARKVVPSSTESSLLILKRPRRSLKLDRSDATTIYRAVIIHRVFTRDAIDFQEIAALIGEENSELVRRKWSTLRRLFGGADSVAKGVETFQNMVMQGINEGSISAADLTSCDPVFFLRFWQEFDFSSELAVDEHPLYSTYDQNSKKYNLDHDSGGATTDLFEKIEDSSMRQKEGFLANTLFAYTSSSDFVTSHSDSKSEYLEIRSVLKSILCIDENQLNSVAAKELLAKFDPQDVQNAADSMIRDRELFLMTVDDQKKFVLSDRFLNALLSRVFTRKFFSDAKTFRDLICNVSNAKKGLIISPGILAGEMTTLLQLISDNKVQLLRIDRTLRFQNYESRLIDREQIACDIIVHSAKPRSLSHKELAVPATGPCDPIWINLKSRVNADLWSKIIMLLLGHVVTKPGITKLTLYLKLLVVLKPDDFEKAVNWLRENGCVVESAESYTATSTWQYILGN